MSCIAKITLDLEIQSDDQVDDHKIMDVVGFAANGRQMEW